MMAKFTDEEVAQKIQEYDRFIERAEIVLGTVEIQSRQIRALEDAQIQEQGRIDAAAKKAVVGMQKSTSYRLRQIAMISAALVTIAGVIFQSSNSAPIDYEKLAAAIKEIGK
jgi:hypothetical protein